MLSWFAQLIISWSATLKSSMLYAPFLMGPRGQGGPDFGDGLSLQPVPSGQVDFEQIG